MFNLIRRLWDTLKSSPKVPEEDLSPTALSLIYSHLTRVDERDFAIIKLSGNGAEFVVQVDRGNADYMYKQLKTITFDIYRDGTLFTADQLVKVLDKLIAENAASERPSATYYINAYTSLKQALLEELFKK